MNNINAMDEPILRPSEPVYIKKNPDPWFNNIRPLTYDEFIEYRTEITVEKRTSNCKQVEPSNVLKAHKSMLKHTDESNAQSYTIHTAENDALYRVFKPPSLVQEKDMFINYFKPADLPCYLRRRNRMFTGFNKHYQSAPQMTYAGLSEWLYVVSGKLVVQIYAPTKMNLVKTSSWEGKDDPSLGPPTHEYLLRENSCLIIPGGWIVTRRAEWDTFIFNGEFLNIDDVNNQLELFDRDVRLTANRYSFDRDSNIRCLYWFFLAKLMDRSRDKINSFDIELVIRLRYYTNSWMKLAEKEPENPALYAPTEMLLRHLCKSFKDYTLRRMKSEGISAKPTMEDQDSDEVLRSYINSNDWTKAIKHRENQIKNDTCSSNELKLLLLNQLFDEYARHLETDEEFNSAITYYEKCGTNTIHVPRLIIKQYMEMCYKHLQNYCIQHRLAKFWCNFNSFLFRETHHSDEIIIHDACHEDRHPTQDAREQRLKDLIETLSPKDWIDNLYLSSEIAKLSLSLSNKALSRLTHTFHRDLQTGSSMRLCNLYLCLDQPEAFLQHCSERVKDAAHLDLSYRYGDHYDSAVSLMKFMSRKNSKKELFQRKEEMAILKNLFRTYIKLGMIDEALKAISQQDIEDSDLELAEMINKLEQMQEDRASCVDFDPRLSDKTLANFKRFMQSNQISSTDSITVLIYLLGIFVYKLEPAIVTSQREDSERLEIMFKYTAKLIVESPFSCSESLLNSANGLISSVKDKLELISDNDAIRDSFRIVVDTIASRCMIESRYKSATMLYSQIEDHVKAIKSLMRTGEIDTVINYSLLVRDVTVNRITINYLRHLQVEPKAIEDFIRQSSIGH